MVRLLVVDTETGGIDPETHSILSFAGVVWNDGEIEAELDLKVVEPLLAVTVQAMQINRISLVDHAVGAVTPQEGAKKLATFLRKHFGAELKAGSKVALAGHNVGFDIGFLKRLCRLGGVSFNELFSHRSLDTSSILRFMGLAGRAPLQGAGLEEALQHFQIVIPEPLRHTALGDARGTAELLNKLISLERVVDEQDKRPNTTARGASRPRAKPGAKKATAPATTIARRTRR
ncbi:MAG: 3'-5' exonuclease [Caulobacterales bacterium]|jgi:DNA polymerase-3 subunit epsilon|nr:3'-5' exonuclease [Caulobacterales bacterium]